MRTITDHIVSGDQSVQLHVTALDEPGAGGACHEYAIAWAEDGEPTGLAVCFQDGDPNEVGINGITDEALIAIVIDRRRGLQKSPFRFRENEIVLTHTEEALMWLQRRTVERIARGVEGTHQK